MQQIIAMFAIIALIFVAIGVVEGITGAFRRAKYGDANISNHRVNEIKAMPYIDQPSVAKKLRNEAREYRRSQRDLPKKPSGRAVGNFYLKHGHAWNQPCTCSSPNLLRHAEKFASNHVIGWHQHQTDEHLRPVFVADPAPKAKPNRNILKGVLLTGRWPMRLRLYVRSRLVAATTKDMTTGTSGT
jgi:hypothetical protein